MNINLPTEGANISQEPTTSKRVNTILSASPEEQETMREEANTALWKSPEALAEVLASTSSNPPHAQSIDAKKNIKVVQGEYGPLIEVKLHGLDYLNQPLTGKLVFDPTGVGLAKEFIVKQDNREVRWSAPNNYLGDNDQIQQLVQRVGLAAINALHKDAIDSTE